MSDGSNNPPPKPERHPPFRRGNRYGKGRPAGSRNAATLALDALGAEAAADVLKVAVDAAKAGDMRAAELVLSRVWPVRKGRPVRLALPPISTAADVSAAMGALLDAVCAGTVTPDEAGAVAALLEARRRAVETEELEGRVRRLEEEETRCGK